MAYVNQDQIRDIEYLIEEIASEVFSQGVSEGQTMETNCYAPSWGMTIDPKLMEEIRNILMGKKKDG